MTTEERIKVMQAYLAGKKVQYRLHAGASWQDFETGEAPSWIAHEYRVKEEPKQYYQIAYTTAQPVSDEIIMYLGSIHTDKEKLKRIYSNCTIVGFFPLPPMIEV